MGLVQKKIAKVYLGNTRVRPENEREPTTNTLLYLPLKTDIADYSGNNVSVTTDTLSEYRTFSNGLCRFNYGASTHEGARTIYDINPEITVGTVNLRVKFDQLRANSHLFTSNIFGLALIADSAKIRLESYTGSGVTNEVYDTSTVTTDTRYMITGVRNGGDIYLYVDGVLKNTATGGSTTSGTNKETVIPGWADTSVDWSLRGYLSDVIFENRVWTADEILKYYNTSVDDYVTDKLLLNLPLTSTYTSTDISSYNRETTNSNVIFGNYVGVDCGYFNGSSHIQIDDLFNQKVPMTISHWVYTTGGVGGGYDGKIYDAGDPRVITLYDQSGGHGYMANVRGTDISDTKQYTNQRIYIALVITNYTSILYLINDYHNEKIVASINSEDFTPSSINIGNEWNNGADRYFIGGISDLKVTNEAWSEEKVKNYYIATKSKYSGGISGEGWNISTAQEDGEGISAGDYYMECLEFSTDGYYYYSSSNADYGPYQVKLETPWDVTSSSTVTDLNSIIHYGSNWDGNGTPHRESSGYAFWNCYNTTVKRWTVTTQWDASTATVDEELTLNGIDLGRGWKFIDNGSKIITSEANNNNIRIYSLSNNYDPTSRTSYKELYIDNNGGDQDYFFSSDGLIFYINSVDRGYIRSYQLSTAYDISTGKMINQLDISEPTGIYFHNNTMYLQFRRGKVKQYTVSKF